MKRIKYNGGRPPFPIYDEVFDPRLHSQTQIKEFSQLYKKILISIT